MNPMPTKEADLRLDTEEAAYAGLKDNPKFHAVVQESPMSRRYGCVLSQKILLI
jgi:hypothetical protein